MAEQKTDARELSWRRLVPWTEIFNGFKLTLDPNKLFLAAAGLLVMAFAWWALASIFGAGYAKDPQAWGSMKNKADDPALAWKQFASQRDSWNLMHKAAGIGGQTAVYTPQDLARNITEVEVFEMVPKPAGEVVPTEMLKQLVENKDVYITKGVDKLKKQGVTAEQTFEDFKTRVNTTVTPERMTQVSLALFQPKPGGSLTTWPWFENRGPNPYLMVTGQVENLWEPGHFWDRFVLKQVPVLIEPLVKLLQPVVYLLHPKADGVMRLYCFLVLLSTLVVWSIFGGAIARITVLYQTRKEQIDAFEAMRFARKRMLSYIGAPLFPLAITLACLLLVMVLGLVFLIPWVGDVLVAGLGWFIFVAIGTGMAVLLIGLVAWPLMPATISTEGRDAWESFSRAYAYLFSKPWQYVWYGLVAIAYGAVLIFFVNFLSSFALFLSKWSLSQTPEAIYPSRAPDFLFIYAPTTFGYRDLLLEGAEVNSVPVVQGGHVNQAVYNAYVESLGYHNKAGAVLVAFWLGIILLLIVGFGYAYFWTVSTLIYLLLRRQIDTAEVDEVYLDDDEGGYKAPPTPGPQRVPTPTPTMPTPTMVPSPTLLPSPTLRPTPIPTPPPASVTPPTPKPEPVVEKKPEPIKPVEEKKPEPVKQVEMKKPEPEPEPVAEKKPEPVKEPEPLKKPEPVKEPEPLKEPEKKSDDF